MMNQKKMTNNHLVLIILAAGSSTRMGTGNKKEFLKLGSGTVLSASLGAFLNYEKNSGNKFSSIIVTVAKGQESSTSRSIKSDPTILSEDIDSRIYFVEGGKTRQESAFLALKKLKSLCGEQDTVVLIHDGARPHVSFQLISEVVETTKKYGAAVPAIPAVDTFKDTNGTETICAHLVRKNLAAVQTPQGFLLEPLLECHKKASQASKEYTDDSEIWDSFPELTCEKKVHITKGDVENKKITYPTDIPENKKTILDDKKMIRIGFGTDLHKLVEGRNFILGGVSIPSEKGELGHSDGDVLLHAISDALLGASGLGDIGSYFPPEDPKWKDADSSELLKKIWSDVKKAGWSLVNMDCVLEFEKPKFLPWRKQVIDSVAKILCVEPDQIFVKAKTNEKLDSIGQTLAIKAYCTCLLEK